MKQIVYKLFWVWQFKKEEQWLNSMASQGLNLTSASLFRYEFEEGVPGEYQYRLEMLDHWPNHPESQAYIRFMEDTGAEMVSSLKNWVYFRRKKAEGPFALFSDLDSRLKHVRRIAALLIPLLLATLAVGLVNLVLGITRHIPETAFNLWLGILALLFALFIGEGLYSILRQIRQLKREREIRE